MYDWTLERSEFGWGVTTFVDRIYLRVSTHVCSPEYMHKIIVTISNTQCTCTHVT